MQDQPTLTTELDLLIVKDFFAANIRRAIVEEMRRSPLSAALTYGKSAATVEERVRRTSRVIPSADTVHFVIQRLDEYRANIERHFRVELGDCEEPQFLRYGIGDFFVAHQDGNTGLINLETDRTRRISVSIFLNWQSASEQSENYCGGSLVFSDWRTGARREVGGEAGTLVAFRSETTHEVMPVTHGERYTIVSWYSRKTATGN